MHALKLRSLRCNFSRGYNWYNLPSEKSYRLNNQSVNVIFLQKGSDEEYFYLGCCLSGSLEIPSLTQNIDQEELSFLKSVLKTSFLIVKLHGFHPTARVRKTKFTRPGVSCVLYCPAFFQCSGIYRNLMPSEVEQCLFSPSLTWEYFALTFTILMNFSVNNK